MKVQELPYTTDDAEFNALVGGALDVGYLPQQDVTSATTNATTGGPEQLAPLELLPLPVGPLRVQLRGAEVRVDG